MTVSSLLQDLRYALRSFATSPVVAAAAVLSLGLGIGANTTVFSFADQLFFRMVPVRDADRLVAVFGTDEKFTTGALRYFPISYLNYLDYRERSRSLFDLAAFTWIRAGLADGNVPEQLMGQLVSANYFEVLGVEPVQGRTFLPEEGGIREQHPVIVLSHGLWRRRFGADPEVVGSKVLLNAHPFTVIGVAEKGFKGPYLTHDFEFWIPIGMYRPVLDPVYVEDRAKGVFNLVGRLQPEAGFDQAVDEVEAIAAQLLTEYPEANRGRRATSMPFAESVIHPNRRPLFVRAGMVLLAVAGLVLLIACFNVANLLLVRAAARRKEIAIRQCMGAGRRRLIQQVLTESALLSLAGAGVGLLLALWGSRLLWRFRPPFFAERSLELGLDVRILLFTLVLASLVGLLFGAVPALQATEWNVASTLKDGGGSQRASCQRSRLRHALLVFQIAFSLVALAGSGLFLTSLWTLRHLEPGFERRHLAVASFDFDAQGYEEPAARAFVQRLLERAEALPGVESAAFAQHRPLAPPIFLETASTEEAADPEKGLRLQRNTVTPGYFATLGIPLIAGRGFRPSDREDGRRVAVINETMAERLWPFDQALGQGFWFKGESERIEVVGVCRDSKINSLGEDDQPYAYLPLAQHHSPVVTLHLRTRGDPAEALVALRPEVQALDPNVPLLRPATISQVIESSLQAQRLAALLLTAFGSLALVLVAIGTYGVFAYNVNRQRYDIGVRIALGASRKNVLWMILRHSMALVAIGLVIGVAVILASTRLVSGMLFGIGDTDVAVVACSTAVLVAISFLASLIPARRAAGLDPALSLKST